MTSSVAIGHGTLLAWDADGATGTYTDFLELVFVTPPNESGDTVDVTHTASPDKYREFKAALLDAGEVTAHFNYVPGNTADVKMREHRRARVFRNYKITFPNAETIIFSGWPGSISPDVPLDDKMTLEVTFKISGKPTHST